MGPIDLYMGFVGGGLEATESIAVWTDLSSAIGELSVIEQAVVSGAGVIVLGVLVVGLLWQYATDTVQTARRSPIISLCIGLPGLLIVAGLFYTGLVLGGTDVGIFFAIPLVTLGAVVIPVSVGIGYTAVGASIVSRLGGDSLTAGIVCGGLVAALVATTPALAVPLTGLAAAVGLGGAARVLFAGGSLRRSTERTVPPANRV